MTKFILIALLAWFSNAYVYAQKPAVVASEKAGWHKIAEMTADFKTDRDSIYVIGKDMFKALKLKVTNAPIHIYKMTVVFETGADEEIATADLPGEMMANTESKVINLKGANRAISRVVFMYRTTGHNKAIETNVD